MRQERIYRTLRFMRRVSLYAWLGLFAMLSCVSEEMTMPRGEDVYVTLRIDVPDGGAAPKSRSLAVADESTIASLRVLVFNAADLFVYEANVENLRDGSAEVRLKRSAHGEQYYMVLLGNADGVTVPATGTAKGVALKGMTFSAKTDTKPGFPSAPGTLLPLWGESISQVIGDGTDFGQTDLYRAVARVDVGLNFKTNGDGSIPDDNLISQGLTNFQLKSVRLYNSLDKGHLAPLGGYGTLSVPEDAAPYAPDPFLDYIITARDMSVREIYLAEVNNHTAAAEVKALKDRCCIVVGGKYNTNPEDLEATEVTYYRVDFLQDGKTDNTLTDILRNHRYAFNIVSVYGQGYDTPEEAFDKASANISVSVAHWDQGLDWVDYDGQDNFQSSSRIVSLAYPAGSTARIAVQSNVPAREWIFENMGTWRDALTVTRPDDGATEGYLTFTANGNGPASAEIRVKIHNLTVTFRVTQSDGIYLSPDGILVNGWDDPNGGEKDVPIISPPSGNVTVNGGDVTVDDPLSGGNSDGVVEVD